MEKKKMSDTKKIIKSKTFGIALLILAGLVAFSFLFQYDQNFSTPFIIMVDDLTSPYREYVRHSNYDASNVLDCNDENNPFNEYECFRDAFSNCHAAIVNPEVYTIEGDPIYANLKINSDCLVEGTADTSTDRFAVPEIITTKCDGIGRNQYTWSVENCDAENLPEMQFNFMMQLYPKISECKENGDTWIDETMECIKQAPNSEDNPIDTE